MRLLGGLTVEGWSDVELGSRKGRTLLKALALQRGTSVPTDRLVEVLWGDDAPSRPAEQVGVLVSRLRGVLGAQRVQRTDSGYRLEIDWLDLDELEHRVEEAAAAMGEGRLGAARTAAMAAVAVARGELLPDEDGEWVDAARASAAALVARAHHIAAAAASVAGDSSAAAASAEAALAHDPYDEVALRTLMRAHAAAGRPASALAAYVRVRDRLVEELGVDPTPETEALHDELVLGGGREAAAATSARKTADGPDLVGRDGEWAWLDARLVEVTTSGRSALVVVRGEPGIGKTALVSAWSEQQAGRAVVLLGHGDELGRDLPLQPIADAVGLHLRALGPSEAARLLGDDAAVVAGVLGWSGPATSPTTVLDPEAGRAQLFGALLAVVERIGQGRPIILVIEDLHHAGASTASWLAFAHRRGSRLLVVATSRPGGPELPGAEVLTVAPLGLADAATLVRDLPAHRLDEIFARSGGNPLFLLALAGMGEGDLPASVRDAIDAQAAALGPAGATVRAAAVLGTEVDLDLLADVLRQPAAQVLADLEAAVTVGLLDDRGAGLAFRHELVRDALDQSAGSTRRSLAHREAARALASRPNPDALAIAVHARLGGELDLAIDAYEKAALEAFARFDTDAARALLDVAVELGGSAAAFTARARVQMATLDLDHAAGDAAEAVARGGGAAALEAAAWVAYYRRRFDDARAFADEGVARAGEDAALRTSCLAVAGRVRHGAGDLDGAVDRLRSAAGGPPAVQGMAAVWLAYARVHQGEPGAALALLERPLIDPDRLAHPWAGLHGRFAKAMALGYLGRSAEALAVCDELDAATDRTGTIGVRFRSPAANVRSWLLRHSGAPEEADEHTRRTLEATSGPDGAPLSDVVAEYHYVALLDLADGRLLAGDIGEAAELTDRLAPIERWSGTMAWHQRHRLAVVRARLALAGGDPPTACGLASEVVADATSRGARRYELLGRGWLALAGGEGDLERLEAVVGGLGTCAALEGWRLVAALADRFAVEAWRREAERRAAALVAAAGPRADALRRTVAATLG